MNKWLIWRNKVCFSWMKNKLCIVVHTKLLYCNISLRLYNFATILLNCYCLEQRCNCKNKSTSDFSYLWRWSLVGWFFCMFCWPLNLYQPFRLGKPSKLIGGKAWDHPNSSNLGIIHKRGGGQVIFSQIQGPTLEMLSIHL